MAQSNVAERGWVGWSTVAGRVVGLDRVGVLLLVLNLLDAVFTLTFLQIGVAEEANPIMRMAYESSPLSFMAIKLGIVNLGVAVLSSYREAVLARFALKFAVAIYAVIVTWHLAFLAHVIFG
jgi:hypothetical protein